MPALVAPIVGFALGVVLAGLCRADAPREGAGVGRARARVAALFAVLVYAPVCAYFIVFAGDWALFYLDDSRAIPSALWLLLVVLDGLAVVGGFWAGYQAARRRADRALIALGAVPAALALAAILSFPREAARGRDVPAGVGQLRHAPRGRGPARVRDPLDGRHDHRRGGDRRASAREAATSEPPLPMGSPSGPSPDAGASRDRPALLGRQRPSQGSLGAVRDVDAEQRLLGDLEEVGVGDDADDLLMKSSTVG